MTYRLTRQLTAPIPLPFPLFLRGSSDHVVRRISGAQGLLGPFSGQVQTFFAWNLPRATSPTLWDLFGTSFLIALWMLQRKFTGTYNQVAFTSSSLYLECAKASPSLQSQNNISHWRTAKEGAVVDGVAGRTSSYIHPSCWSCQWRCRAHLVLHTPILLVA